MGIKKNMIEKIATINHYKWYLKRLIALLVKRNVQNVEVTTKTINENTIATIKLPRKNTFCLIAAHVSSNIDSQMINTKNTKIS